MTIAWVWRSTMSSTRQCERGERIDEGGRARHERRPIAFFKTRIALNAAFTASKTRREGLVVGCKDIDREGAGLRHCGERRRRALEANNERGRR